MPAVVGDIDIHLLAGSAVLEIGDAFKLFPESIINAYAGQNSFSVRPKKAILINEDQTLFIQGADEDDNIR